MLSQVPTATKQAAAWIAEHQKHKAAARPTDTVRESGKINPQAASSGKPHIQDDAPLPPLAALKVVFAGLRDQFFQTPNFLRRRCVLLARDQILIDGAPSKDDGRESREQVSTVVIAGHTSKSMNRHCRSFGARPALLLQSPQTGLSTVV